VIGVLFRYPIVAAREDRIGFAHRIAGVKRVDPIERPTADNAVQHPAGIGREALAPADGEVPDAAESERLRLVQVVQLVNQRLLYVPVVQAVIRLK